MKHKRPRAEAQGLVDELLLAVGLERFAKVEIAGSIRRKVDQVGDAEVVFIQRADPRPDPSALPGLAPEISVPLVWEALDKLDAKGVVSRHLYGETKTQRWGEKYRGVDYRGLLVEFFAATPETWGAILLIRTGPADFSRRIVSRFKAGGIYRQEDGRLVHVQTGDPVATRTEEDYLQLCGLPYEPPELRR